MHLNTFQQGDLIVKTFVKFRWRLYPLLTLAKTKIRWDAICLRFSVAGRGKYSQLRRIPTEAPRTCGRGGQPGPGRAGQGSGQGGGQGNKIIWFMVEIIRVVQKLAIMPRPGPSTTARVWLWLLNNAAVTMLFLLFALARPRCWAGADTKICSFNETVQFSRDRLTEDKVEKGC